MHRLEHGKTSFFAQIVFLSCACAKLVVVVWLLCPLSHTHSLSLIPVYPSHFEVDVGVCSFMFKGAVFFFFFWVYSFLHQSRCPTMWFLDRLILLLCPSCSVAVLFVMFMFMFMCLCCGVKIINSNKRWLLIGSRPQGRHHKSPLSPLLLCHGSHFS